MNAVTGFFSIIYVPGRLIVSGNASATAHYILASERLFRLGIASEVICAVEFVYLLWVLHSFLLGFCVMAERVGFEPTVGVSLHTLSKRAP